ncbi:MAG: hypothetical protein LBT76_00065, partial [Tannerella sp.]|nr:hypothetical protein [Tannerella sp.]
GGKIRRRLAKHLRALDENRYFRDFRLEFNILFFLCGKRQSKPREPEKQTSFHDLFHFKYYR